jgi:hypothetical protein
MPGKGPALSAAMSEPENVLCKYTGSLSEGGPRGSWAAAPQCLETVLAAWEAHSEAWFRSPEV